jgi:hypothetical protein
VPSQERDSTSVKIQPIPIPKDQVSTAGPATSSNWTSVNIQPIHIPQDEGSIADAATSSGWSQTRAFRTWWQNRNEQREELLDAVRFETAEVKPESEDTN